VNAPLVLTLLAASFAPTAARIAPAAPPAAVVAATAEDVPALVKRCVAAYGGKEALARAAVTRQEGRVTSLLHQGQSGRIARAYARPGKLRVETSWPDGTGEIRILDGGRGWREGEEVSGPRLAAMLLQAARLDIPALLSAWVAKVEDHGTGQVDGRPVRILSLQPAPGLVVQAEVEVATGRVLRSRGASVDPGMPLAFETTYGDFRKVDGVLVPFLEKNWANGRSTGETILEKVTFPKSLPDSTFRP
jgi:hypothetical protein